MEAFLSHGQDSARTAGSFLQDPAGRILAGGSRAPSRGADGACGILPITALAMGRNLPGRRGRRDGKRRQERDCPLNRLASSRPSRLGPDLAPVVLRADEDFAEIKL
jgi:hypothetical protein